jgi:hypothetical protein
VSSRWISASISTRPASWTAGRRSSVGCSRQGGSRRRNSWPGCPAEGRERAVMTGPTGHNTAASYPGSLTDPRAHRIAGTPRRPRLTQAMVLETDRHAGTSSGCERRARRPPTPISLVFDGRTPGTAGRYLHRLAGCWSSRRGRGRRTRDCAKRGDRHAGDVKAWGSTRSGARAPRC